jgi:hypothetical protein
MNSEGVVPVESIHCIILGNLLKVHDVPKIPADHEFAASNRCQRDV